MRKLKLLSFTVLVLFLGMIVVSCSGDDGEQGPAGADGNANVKVGTLDLTASDWLWRGSYIFSIGNTSSTSHYTRYVDINVPAITESIHETGLVLVYYKLYRHADDWDMLPFHFTNIGGGLITNIAFRSEVSKIRLHYFWSSNDAGIPIPTNLETYAIADAKVKYVVIEGSAMGSIAAKTKQSREDILNELKNANIDIKDYYAVCNYYAVNPEE